MVKGGAGLVDGRYVVDEEDASVSRTRSHLLDQVRQVREYVSEWASKQEAVLCVTSQLFCLADWLLYAAPSRQ